MKRLAFGIVFLIVFGACGDDALMTGSEPTVDSTVSAATPATELPATTTTEPASTTTTEPPAATTTEPPTTTATTTAGLQPEDPDCTVLMAASYFRWVAGADLQAFNESAEALPALTDAVLHINPDANMDEFIALQDRAAMRDWLFEIVFMSRVYDQSQDPSVSSTGFLSDQFIICSTFPGVAMEQEFAEPGQDTMDFFGEMFARRFDLPFG